MLKNRRLGTLQIPAFSPMSPQANRPGRDPGKGHTRVHLAASTSASRNSHRKEGLTLPTFTAEASREPGRPRTGSAGAGPPDSRPFLRRPRLPTESEEVWRYSPINELSLDDFVAPRSTHPLTATPPGTAAGPRAARVGPATALGPYGRQRPSCTEDVPLTGTWTPHRWADAGGAAFWFGPADEVGHVRRPASDRSQNGGDRRWCGFKTSLQWP